jgi:hypothetical protein
MAFFSFGGSLFGDLHCTAWKAWLSIRAPRSSPAASMLAMPTLG